MENRLQTKPVELEYDYVVIGSGFGGSVSALRLVEKGYRVCVLESGRWLFVPSVQSQCFSIKTGVTE
jgi:choline dehydrogenase-like flavoprotein